MVLLLVMVIVYKAISKQSVNTLGCRILYLVYYIFIVTFTVNIVSN